VEGWEQRNSHHPVIIDMIEAPSERSLVPVATPFTTLSAVVNNTAIACPHVPRHLRAFLTPPSRCYGAARQSDDKLGLPAPLLLKFVLQEGAGRGERDGWCVVGGATGLHWQRESQIGASQFRVVIIRSYAGLAQSRISADISGKCHPRPGSDILMDRPHPP